MTSLWTTCKDVGNFAWKHRNKIMLAGAVISGAGLYYYLSESIGETDRNNKDEEENERINVENRSRLASVQKKNQLSTIRKQFENARERFLLTLRAKIIEVIDVSNVVKEIQKLRRSGDTGDKHTEELLWSQIKISSITMLFSSVYVTCLLCIILKLQFHMLGNYQSELNDSIQESSGDSNSSKGFRMDSQIFLGLLEKTYKNMLSEGLVALGEKVKTHAFTVFGDHAHERSHESSLDESHSRVSKKDWRVLECKQVKHADLIAHFMTLRKLIEKDNGLIDLILQLGKIERSVEEVDDLESIRMKNSGASDRSSSSTADKSAVIDIILKQTKAITTYPCMHTVFQEAVDTCFQRLFEELRVRCFEVNDDASGNELNLSATREKVPAFASLLPQFKQLVTSVLLPTEGISLIANEISGLSSLDSLSLSVFDMQMNFPK